MNDDITSLGRMINVDAATYFTPPYASVPSITISDRIDPSAIRAQSIAKSDIDKIYLDIRDVRAHVSRSESRCSNRIALLGTDIDVLRTLIVTLQTTVAQQSEAMQILAAEIDELKSGQLEPLEDME